AQHPAIYTFITTVFHFSLDLHSKMHSATCGLKLAANHKIVLTAQRSGRILLLREVEVKRLEKP
ncbi:MAG: hypothetical protein WAK56_10135, partial [Candidatus Sulfotelmatobacter sp.]